MHFEEPVVAARMESRVLYVATVTAVLMLALDGTTMAKTMIPATTTTYSTSRTTGVSVCLRYAVDLQSSFPTISLVTPSSSLVLRVTSPGTYTLTLNEYNRLVLRVPRYLWPIGSQSIWTSACLTVDIAKLVAQVFEDTNMSIRKILPTTFVWTGGPVIDISCFDGQVTDIQVWDYPVSYREIFYYMTSRPYRSYGGNFLTWSDISYSPRGRVLLEDSYEEPARRPIGTGRRTKQILYRALKTIRKL